MAGLNQLTPENRATFLEREAFVLVAQTITNEHCSYQFFADGESLVWVDDAGSDKKRLSEWVGDLAAFSDLEHDSADVAELALQVQRLMTTEQGDLTTALMINGLKPVSGAKRG